MIGLALAAMLAGSTPPAVRAASRIVYVSADPSDSTSCRLVEPDQWTCETPSDRASTRLSGMVVIVGPEAIAYRSTMPTDASFHVRRWARLLMIDQRSMADDDLAHASMTAWTPLRFRFQPLSTRLVPAQDPSTDILTLGPGAFWVAGDDADPDQFLIVGGGRFAVTRVMVSTLVAGDIAVPFVLAPAQDASLDGRVQDAQGNDVAETDVELFEPLDPTTGAGDLTDDQLVASRLLRTGRVDTRPDGTFTFDHVGAGPFVVVVTDRRSGRGRAVVRASTEPALIRLTAPAYALGRVLRDALPAEGVRVRLVPDPQALAAATDVRNLAAPELTTPADGRFAIVLPPVLSGALLLVAPDGASIAIPLPAHAGTADLNFGDVMLAAPRRVAVQLSDGDGCVLSAIGPAGALGVSIITQAAAAGIVRWLDVTGPGTWELRADCGARAVSVIPDSLVVNETGPAPVVDARVVPRR